MKNLEIRKLRQLYIQKGCETIYIIDDLHEEFVDDTFATTENDCDDIQLVKKDPGLEKANGLASNQDIHHKSSRHYGIFPCI